MATRQEEAIIIRGSRYELTFKVNPPDDNPMSRKEGYILSEETRMRAKEKVKQRASLRLRDAARDKSYRNLDYAEAYAKIILDEVDESKLTEYVSRCLANIELARQRMSNDQIEIDRLREETRSLIADLMIA